MKLSTRTRYGVRAMLELAGSYGKGPLQIKVIAHRQDISVKYLERLIAILKSAGLVKSIRGSKGGYVLAKTPNQIKLGDVFNCLEGRSAITVECVENENYCVRAADCVTRQIWTQLQETMENILQSITLQDLIDKTNEQRRIRNTMYEMDEQLLEKIETLKRQRRAVILAHNYQPGEIQDLADFTGDSLGLSIKAAETDAKVIVFCGVQFMAETAAILSPGKTVLLPDNSAGCPLADTLTAEQLTELKQQHPDALVVCYVNSSAEVKAESDYCCTSANAAEVVQSLPKDRQIVFVPDQHLGKFAAERTSKKLVLWQGCCPTHIMITEDDIKNAKAKYPDAIVMTHPECTEPVKEISDQILSTGQMLRYAKKSKAKQFIIATETGMIHALKKQNPNTEFIAASNRAICPDMKRITLEKIIRSLEDMQYKVEVPEETAKKARKAIDRMVEILPTE